ncbi:MAG TPA: amidohydrolase family protein [Actinomycetales bacterium]
MVDAHHHLWDLREHPQDWVDPTTMGLLLRDFDVPHLLADAAGHADLVATVVVQSVHDADETTHLLARAQRWPVLAGVVGWADLTAPDLADRLAAWRAAAGGHRLVGLRHVVQGEADPAWLDRPAVRGGLGTLAETGLVFDLLLTTTQLPAAVRTVRALPQLRFVLDHLAKPPIGTPAMARWAEGVRALAAEPNVSAKVSGLVTEVPAHPWAVDDLRPAVELALDAFGPHRLMFGSDWPVCRLAAPYADVVGSLRRLLSGLSPDEQDAVWSRTACRVYGLPLATSSATTDEGQR